MKLDIESSSEKSRRQYDPPYKVVNPPRDVSKDELPFEEIDTPGNWNSFSFRTLFKTIKEDERKYKHHCLPTSCVKVPKDQNHQRIIDGWIFYYNGWNTNSTTKSDVEDSTKKNTNSHESMDTKDIENVINTNINDYRFFNANMNADAVNTNDVTKNKIDNKIDYNSDTEIEPVYIFCDGANRKGRIPTKKV